MVSITKYIILGLGILAATFFFKEAAASSLTGTLARTGLAGQSVGTGIGAVGAGVGEAGVRLLDPFFSLADLFAKFGGLFGTPSGETVTSTTTPNITTTGGVKYVGSTETIGDTGGGAALGTGGSGIDGGQTNTAQSGVSLSTPAGSVVSRISRPNPRFG